MRAGKLGSSKSSQNGWQGIANKNTRRATANVPQPRLASKRNWIKKRTRTWGTRLALYFAFYNFCRVHSTLRVTPAMEAGIAQHVWSIDEIIGLLEAREQKAA